MSFGALTHATTQPEPPSKKTPLIKIFIGPTNLKGRHPAIARSTMTPVILFESTFTHLNGTLGRFFGKMLPVMVVGRKCRMFGYDEFIPRMQDAAFIHREAGGYHILARIYSDDCSGKEARQRLHSVAQELEEISWNKSSEKSRSSVSSGSIGYSSMSTRSSVSSSSVFSDFSSNNLHSFSSSAFKSSY